MRLQWGLRRGCEGCKCSISSGHNEGSPSSVREPPPPTTTKYGPSHESMLPSPPKGVGHRAIDRHRAWDQTPLIARPTAGQGKQGAPHRFNVGDSMMCSSSTYSGYIRMMPISFSPRSQSQGPRPRAQVSPKGLLTHVSGSHHYNWLSHSRLVSALPPHLRLDLEDHEGLGGS
jgi:hypothetical protein